ncbi:MAG: hypothetical protein ACI92I_000454 [Acidimicrobiales bacterium]|jgi:hypothetical protein
MSLKITKLVTLLLGIFLCVIFTILYQSKESDTYLAEEAEACDAINIQQSLKIDCWMSIIQETFQESGTQGAFDDFIYIYTNFETFANTGCHKHAHRVGDLAFYYEYLSHGDLSLVEFPMNATTCGYGFYHGFIEHLVQNTPTSKYVDEICPYLTSTIKTVAPAISQTCYHGAGHGFLIAQADVLIDPREWSIVNFITVPLQRCDSLLQSTDSERKECYLGVFTVLTEWMFDNEYGLVYDRQYPYVHCDLLINPLHQEACYYETTQKFDYISNYNLKNTKKLIESGDRADIEEHLYEIALTGFIQRDTGTDGLDFLHTCKEVFENEIAMCIRVVIGGLIEHGPAQIQYKQVNQFCSNKILSPDEKRICIDAYAHKLERFNTKDEIQNMCSEGYLMKDLCIANFDSL